MVYKKQEKPIVNIAQQKQVDEFYLPPSREELSRMYSVYSKMKAKNLITKIGDLEVSTFVTPQDVFLNQEKKVSYGAYAGLVNLAIDVCNAVNNKVFKVVGSPEPWGN